MRFDKMQLFRCFFACGNYADRKKMVKKIGLDSIKSASGRSGGGVFARHGIEKEGQWKVKT